MLTPTSSTASIPVEDAFTSVAPVQSPASSYHSAAYAPAWSMKTTL